MPTPLFPSHAISHMSGNALARMNNSEHSPFEKFSILYYGEADGDEIVALLKEVAPDIWVEDVRFSDDVFTYQEISETPDQVVLYDASRERTLTIDWTTFDVTVSDGSGEITYDLIDYDHSLIPYTI